jgi:hypothetical protein
MEWVVVLVLVVVVVAVVVAGRRGKERELAQRKAELDPVQKLAFEDVTALGIDLQDLDSELAGQELDEGARADYQRALDAYESAKVSADSMTAPDQVRHVTEILDDGRYAIACVRARAAGQPLPTRRPPCFFDPRHGLSVTDVEWTPPAGAARQVPACALDAERVRAGAEPDSRQVMVGAQRMPYYEGGRAYAPYASGYFGGGANMLFSGLLIGSLLGGGFGGGWGDGGGDGGSDGGSDGGDGDSGGSDGGDGGGGDAGGDAGGDGGGDGGGFFDGGFGGDGGGDFGGFDF